MMNRSMLFAIAIFVLVAGFACSNGGGNPVTPGTNPSLSPQTVQAASSQTQLWGVWDIGIDLETLSATVTSDRNVEIHFNILPFLTPPKCSDCLKLHINSFDEATRILDIDVTLYNKFAVAGYDVRGILFTDDLGHMLKNEDAWTALYDIPGGDTINPFIAFAKGDPLRQFPGYGLLTENYRIWVPDPPKYLLVKYAVDASYPSNCLEPYAIENLTQEEILAVPGSHGIVSVDVKDWQGDVDSVILYAPDLNNDVVVLTHQTGDTWSGDIVNVKATTPGVYKAKIKATSTGSGTTALYYFGNITVGGWARTWGGSYYDYGHGVAVDGSGNVYVTGEFDTIFNVDFDPGTGVDNHTSYGSPDVFLSKFDSSGNFVWARTWGGGYDDESYGVSVDGSGNVYATGSFRGSVDFDPGSGVDIHTSNLWHNIFLSKFDSSGNFVWARTWGGSYDDWGFDVAADGSGNVYVTGSFCLTVDFDPGGGVDNHISNGGMDIFLSKFDASGNFQWARSWGGSDYDNGYGVAADGSGNAYVTGFFSGTADFDPGSGVDNHSAIGNCDIFLSEFDSSGNFKWARTWGGSSCYVEGWGVAVDGSDNAYVAGYFNGTVDFDPGTGVDNRTSNGGSFDIFLSKFDSSGNFQWADTWGGSGDDEGYGVAVDKSNSAYVAGYFNGAVDFDPGSGVDNHTSAGKKDISLSKFDASGNFQWARTWGGSNDDEGWSAAADASGNVYVAGYFTGTGDFDPGSAVDNHTSNGLKDIWLSKFDSSGNFKWAETWGGNADDWGFGVAVDVSGNMHVTGYFQGTVDFDPGSGVDNHTSGGDYDAFLSKFDSSGNLKWARTPDTSYGYGNSRGVAVDVLGNAYVIGFISGTVDFDPGSGIDNHTSNGGLDALLSKFDPNGNW